jgi:DNA-binding CsgD family transcriptional regulator
VRSEEIYEALFDDEALARLPDLLCRAGNSRSAMLVWRHNDGLSENIAYNYFEPDWFTAYGAFADRDPYRIFAFQPANLNRLILPNEVISSKAFERTQIYNELVRRHGDDTVYCMGTAIESAWGFGTIGLHRGRKAQAFDARDGKRLERVAIHVERVLRARGEIAAARRAASFAQGALDAVGLVAITVQSGGRIFHSNAAAECVLQRGDGLVARNGILTAAQHRAAVQLEDAVARATAPFSPAASAVVVERGEDEPAYLVTITPLTGRIGEPAALLLFRDPAVPDNSLAMRLHALFGLTNAEAAVAIDLAGGLPLADIARNRGVKVTTLRAQLKSIAVKTGCSRQSELVALLRRLPPVVT